MKNILKKQILWAIPLAFSLLTSSCSDYLDKLPENTVEVEGIDYTNKSNMYMPVSGVYATARGYLGSLVLVWTQATVSWRTRPVSAACRIPVLDGAPPRSSRTWSPVPGGP